MSRMLSILALVLALPVQAATKNGFDITDALVPVKEIRRGGPGKDGIPAILSPQFGRAADAGFMRGEDRVLGISIGGVHKAFPVKILNWHEVVNDWTQSQRFVMTYCPLCGSGIAFAVEDEAFGVSGLLYNSDVLLYDFATESLWSQIMMQAVAGPQKGTRLQQLPVLHTTWEQWRMLHPDTLVLTRDTGYRGYDYRTNPYRQYERDRQLAFPVSHRDTRLPSKTWVLGVTLGDEHVAYPLQALAKVGHVDDVIAGQAVQVRFDEGSAWVERDGVTLPTIRLYWFAWATFHPDTRLFEPD